MATSPVALDKTPAPPPEVTGQMGNPLSALSSVVQAIRARAAQNGAAAPGQPPAAAPNSPPNPDGAFLSKQALIEQALVEMSSMKAGFAPWANRIKSLMLAGVAESVGSPVTGQEPQPTSAATGAAPFAGAQKLPEGEGKGFPG